MWSLGVWVGEEVVEGGWGEPKISLESETLRVSGHPGTLPTQVPPYLPDKLSREGPVRGPDHVELSDGRRKKGLLRDKTYGH